MDAMILDRLTNLVYQGDLIIWDTGEIFGHKSPEEPRDKRWVIACVEVLERNYIKAVVHSVSEQWKYTYPVGKPVPCIVSASNGTYTITWRKVRQDWWDVWGVQ